MVHAFKIETKPTFWDIMLSSGEYSDYSEEHHFIRANDKDEAWFLFKEYWKQTHRPKDYAYNECLVFEGEGFAPYAARYRRGYDKGQDWNFEAAYGDAYDVQINQLAVIEFKS